MLLDIKMTKKTIILTFMLTYMMNSCGPIDDPVEYFDAVVMPANEVLIKEGDFRDVMMEFIEQEDSAKTENDVFSEEDLMKLDSALTDLTGQIKHAIEVIEKLPPYLEKTVLKDAAISFLNVFLEVSEKEYVEVVKIIKMPEEECTEEDINRFHEVFEKYADPKLDRAVNDFIKVQEAFADEYEIDLEMEE